MISNPREFVRLWLNTHKITIDERGGLQSPDNRDNFELFGSLYLDYCEQIVNFNHKANKKVPVSSDTNIQRALDELISLHVTEGRKRIFEQIKFSGNENLSSLMQFVKALTGEIAPQVVAVFAHYLWAIKRRMNNKEVVWHIMPIIFGREQGAGKSFAIIQLLKPLGDLYQKLQLPSVVDTRVQMSFGRTYAVLIDEMALAGKTDIDALKNLITSSEMDVRRLYTHQVLKVKQNVNLIGTTNRPVAEIIYDTTGARRFYEVKALKKLDWDAINAINYLELWQGINENRERGYYEEQQDAIKADQEHLIGIEDLQVFLDLNNIRPGTKEISSTLLYEAYRQWCETNGATKNILTGSWFGRKLTGRGFLPSQQKRIKGKLGSVYFINEDSEMHQKSSYDPLLSPAVRN